MSLFRGLFAPFSGAKLIFKNRSMTILALVPFFLNLIVLFFLLFYVYDNLNGYVAGLIPEGSEKTAYWFFLLKRVAKVALGILLFLLISLIYLSTAAVVNGPFSGILSEMAERKITGKEKETGAFSFKNFFRDLGRVFSQEVRKVILLVIVLVLSLLLNIIPIVGQFLYIAVNYLSLVFFTGLEYLDFPMENRKMVFRDKLNFAKKNFLLTAGIGITVTVFMYIPLIFSSAAVGATKVYLYHEKNFILPK